MPPKSPLSVVSGWVCSASWELTATMSVQNGPRSWLGLWQKSPCFIGGSDPKYPSTMTWGVSNRHPTQSKLQAGWAPVTLLLCWKFPLLSWVEEIARQCGTLTVTILSRLRPKPKVTVLLNLCVWSRAGMLVLPAKRLWWVNRPVGWAGLGCQSYRVFYLD
jgi:hypothetical protein